MKIFACAFAIGLLLSVSPLPQFMEILRPLWLALLLANPYPPTITICESMRDSRRAHLSTRGSTKW